jgi:hypothetical protein
MNHVLVSAHTTVNSYLFEFSIFIFGYSLDGVYICSPNKRWAITAVGAIVTLIRSAFMLGHTIIKVKGSLL